MKTTLLLAILTLLLVNCSEDSNRLSSISSENDILETTTNMLEKYNLEDQIYINNVTDAPFLHEYQTLDTTLTTITFENNSYTIEAYKVITTLENGREYKYGKTITIKNVYTADKDYILNWLKTEWCTK